MGKDQQGHSKVFQSEDPNITNRRGMKVKYLLGRAISTLIIMVIEISEKQTMQAVGEILPCLLLI